MKIAIAIPFLIICLTLSIIGIKFAYRASSRIYLGIETSSRAKLTNSIILGATGSMIMLVMIILLSIIDIDFNWTVNGFIVIMILELFIFIGIFLGTLWGFSSVGKYRNYLFKRLKEKYNTEQKRN